MWHCKKWASFNQDLSGTCKKIAAFLERPLTDEQVDRICRHCHVDNMRSNDKVNMSYWRDVKEVNDAEGGGFINKGLPNDRHLTYRSSRSCRQPFILFILFKLCPSPDNISSVEIQFTFYYYILWADDSIHLMYQVKWPYYITKMFAGKVGLWKDLLTPEVVQKIDGMMAQLDGSGLSIRDV